MYKYLRGGMIALLLTLGCAVANAQLTLTLVPDTQSVAPGSTITFFGVLSNTGPDNIFINGDTFSLIGQGLTVDDTKFNLNAPTELGAGQSTGTLSLYDVTADFTAIPASYPGAFSVIGGADSNAQDLLTVTPFTVNVSSGAVSPEPCSFLLLGVTLPVLGIVRRRKA